MLKIKELLTEKKHNKNIKYKKGDIVIFSDGTHWFPQEFIGLTVKEIEIMMDKEVCNILSAGSLKTRYERKIKEQKID